MSAQGVFYWVGVVVVTAVCIVALVYIVEPLAELIDSVRLRGRSHSTPLLPRLSGQTVLLTGAAGGLGTRIAHRILDEGAQHLILWDIDATSLRALCDEISRARHHVAHFSQLSGSGPFTRETAPAPRGISKSDSASKICSPPLATCVSAFAFDIADSAALEAAWRAIPLATAPEPTDSAQAGATPHNGVAVPHVVISNAGCVFPGPCWRKATTPTAAAATTTSAVAAAETAIAAASASSQLWERTLAVNTLAPLRLLTLMFHTYEATAAPTAAVALAPGAPVLPQTAGPAAAGSARAHALQYQFVAVSSASAASYAAGLSDYVASKAALTHALRSLRLDALKAACAGTSGGTGRVCRVLRWLYQRSPLSCVVSPPRWLAYSALNTGNRPHTLAPLLQTALIMPWHIDTPMFDGITLIPPVAALFPPLSAAAVADAVAGSVARCAARAAACGYPAAGGSELWLPALMKPSVAVLGALPTCLGDFLTGIAGGWGGMDGFRGRAEAASITT